MSAHTPRPDTASGLIETDQRSREIFRQIVDGYLATGEPVGSRNIARLLPMSLSPATVRNVMTDLELAGLIYAPHTSAGRLPTERGLRFFVDAMMEVGNLTAEERARIEAQMKAAATGRTLDGTLTEASALLSGLSRGAGVVVTTKANARLKHIEFVRLDPTRALVVLVADDGTVKVDRIVTAVDCGMTVNPDTIAAQAEGGALYGLTAGLYAHGGREFPQRPHPRQNAGRAARRDRPASRADGARTRLADRAAGRERHRHLLGAEFRPPPHRARPGQSAGGPQGAGGP